MQKIGFFLGLLLTILSISKLYGGGSSSVGKAPPARPATAPSNATADATGLSHNLAEFGPIDTPAHAQATYAEAVESLRKTGGILVVPASISKSLKSIPLQGLIRTPAAPEETKRWKTGDGVTVVVADETHTTIDVPPLSGLVLNRDFRLAPGDSSPHWGTHPMLEVDSQVTYGSISYLDYAQLPTPKGKDARFYVPTVRGLTPGMFLNLHGGPGYGGRVTRGCIKTVGWDPDKKLYYFTADTEIDHVAGAIYHNKTNTALVHMKQTSNCDNQTYDVKVIRNQYAHGDTYIYYCDFNYMSNVHSAAGDENGNCYAAFVRSLDGAFRGTVDSIDWDQSTLKFKSGANINTLGDSRPLINLNPKKAITAGNVVIVPAECYQEATDTGACAFEGHTYPTRLWTNPKTNVKELKMGGLIHGDKDCPWTSDIIGRYFAVTNPEERTTKGTLRWYEITALTLNKDGTKDIEIKRYWWGAKSAGSPTLYLKDSYSTDGHIHPLQYVIAPGAYVNDVSRAIPGSDRGGQNILGLSKNPDAGKDHDFAPGDPVEQAIGPDPFKPTVFRSWVWEDVPGAFPSTMFDLANHGSTARHSIFNIHGGGSTLADLEKRKDKKASWDNILLVDTAVGIGIKFNGDVTNAAILFAQPGVEQPIKWNYGIEENKQPKQASLTVSRDTGEFNFKGAGLRAGGSVAEVQGLSADKTQARNLRGKNIAIAEKATTFRVKFAQSEADGDYAVFVEKSWLGDRAISDKTADGFTVTFASPAPAKATIDWMIVR